jgi:hypothetical protein
MANQSDIDKMIDDFKKDMLAHLQSLPGTERSRYEREQSLLESLDELIKKISEFYKEANQRTRIP